MKLEENLAQINWNSAVVNLYISIVSISSMPVKILRDKVEFHQQFSDL